MSRDKLLINVGLMVALVVVVVLLLLVPSTRYTPHGIVLPAKAAPNEPVQSHVVFLRQFPSSYQTIGTLRAEQHIVQNNQQEALRFADYVKHLAAQKGANAVVINKFGKVFPGGPESALRHYVFLGTAIYVKGH